VKAKRTVPFLLPGVVLSLSLILTGHVTGLSLQEAVIEAEGSSLNTFGYGLATADPNDNRAHDLGFNWVAVYDVPAGPLSTKVLYRVNANGEDWHNLTRFYWDVYWLAMGYGDYIDAYEIGNEVNLHDEWKDAPDASRYVDLLCTARYALRQADPTALVISAGLSPVGRIEGDWGGHAGHDGTMQDEREFLKEFLHFNGQLCADALGYHPMGFSADYDAEPDVDGGTPATNCANGFCFRGMEKIREIMEERGAGYLKIWATEVGWITEPAEECIGHPSWKGRYWQIVSPQRQAENLVGAFEYARTNWPWLQALFVFNLDFNTAPYYEPCEQMRYYSILGRDAEAALQAMTKLDQRIYLPLTLRLK
jgi:hypothetical protein